ncbi:MAG: putative glycoside hydrolase, partial [Burkholderiales bacterium]
MTLSKFLRGALAAFLLSTAASLHTLAAAAGSKFIQTATLYYGSGPTLTAVDASKLAQFDILSIDRFRYQQIPPNTWAAIKALNPGMEIYLYELGPEMVNNQDSTQQLFINTLGRYNVSRGHPMGSLNGNHPELFLLDSTGARVYNAIFSNPGAGMYSYLLDFGSSAYQSYWVTAVEADITSQPWVADGVFADVCTTRQADAGENTVPVKYPTDTAWSAAMNSFAQAITAGMHGVGQKLWCNRTTSSTPEGSAAWLALDASANPPDAIMEEGAFAVEWGPWATQFYPEDVWKRQLDTMAAIQHSKVTLLSHTALAPGASGTDNWGKPVTFWQTLWYSMGSFLLGKNDVLNNDYFMFHGADGEYNAILRYAEYDNLDLGKAVGPYAVTTVGGVNVYWREFQKGYVFVNPTPNDVPALTLPQPGQQLTHDNLLSALGSIPVVSTIALPGHNGAVVLKLASAGDTTPPTVSISSPASGASVGGTFTVSASASDDVGVAGVQFQLDGA